MTFFTPEAINAMLKAHRPEARCCCLEVSSKHATATRGSSSLRTRPGGYISGPAQFAASDAALWFLCFGAVGMIEPLALTSDLSIRFLRPAKGDAIHARADLDKVGRRSVIGTVRVWTDDPASPCAVAQGCYVRPVALNN